MELAELAAEFVRESIRGNRDQATRMLAEQPELVDGGLATQIVLGEADRVRAALAADPALVTTPDPQAGWHALQVAVPRLDATYHSLRRLPPGLPGYKSS